jgi:dihydrofolate reductase
MGKLIYTALGSVDGYFEDADGRFDWAEPDEEVHAFVNDLERPIETYLYGRRMYETMLYWETVDTAGQPAVYGDFAGIWRAAEKVVYSRTLQTPTSARTRVERDFDPEAVRQLKRSSTADLAVGGGDLAGQAIRAGLVDEVHLFLSPVVIGGGKRTLQDGLRAQLELLDERRFNSGVVHLRYRDRDRDRSDT